MIEVKVRLSISVLGAQLLSEQECSENPKKNYNVEQISVKFRSKKGKLQKETIVVHTRKNRLIKQAINISKEAYDYMTDANQPPTEKLAKKQYVNKIIGKDKTGKPKKVKVETTVWAQQYTPIKRLDWHMARIAESLGAASYSFEILDD